MFDWAQLTLFLFASARVAGFILFNPILGRSNIPAAFRTGVVLVLSIFVTSITEQQPPAPSGAVELFVLLLLEIFIGFLLGMAVSIFFYVPQLAGSMIDTQMGMTMNQMYDPGSQANLSVTGQLLNIMMILLFFVEGGHFTLLRLFLTSEQIVPFGQVSISLDAYDLLLELFAECTLLGIKLCMPILAAEMVSQVGMGVLMKVIPQINVFVINIDLKVLVGLGLLLMLMAPFSEFLLQVEAAMLASLADLLALTG